MIITQLIINNIIATKILRKHNNFFSDKTYVFRALSYFNAVYTNNEMLLN